jgi:hypothetical protein
VLLVSAALGGLIYVLSGGPELRASAAAEAATPAARAPGTGGEA